LSILERARAIVEKEDQGSKITEIPVDPEKNPFTFAFISPDGKKVASVDMENRIWITDATSGNEVQLTKTPEFKDLCYWSPDSQNIAYVGILNNTYNIYVVSAQGGTPKTLIDRNRDADYIKENGEFWPSSWSPESQYFNCTFFKKGDCGYPDIRKGMERHL
jgi:Tol biopolymer transport system component